MKNELRFWDKLDPVQSGIEGFKDQNVSWKYEISISKYSKSLRIWKILQKFKLYSIDSSTTSSDGYSQTYVEHNVNLCFSKWDLEVMRLWD